MVMGGDEGERGDEFNDNAIDTDGIRLHQRGTLQPGALSGLVVLEWLS